MITSVMRRKNQYFKMNLIVLCICLTLAPFIQAFQEKEETRTTPSLRDDSSTSSEEAHSSSESYSSEEMNINGTISTTPSSLNSTRINRNIDEAMFSSSSSSASSSEEVYSSTEMITVTVPSVNRTGDNDSLSTLVTTPVTTPVSTAAATSVTATVTSSPENTTTSQMLPLKQMTSECEENHLRSDKCLQDALFVGQTSAVIPKSEGEMDSYCTVKKQDFNCIKEFGTKCLKNVPRQIYLTITKNVRKMFKEFCDTSTGKKTFLKHLECAKPEHLKILNEVLGRLTLSLDYVANNVSRDDMIFHACCTLQDTYKKIPIVMGNMCTPKDTPLETIEFFRSLIRRTVGDIVDIGCGKYASLTYCEENLPNGMIAMRNYANDANRQLPAMSFMSPLMQFAQKLDGQQ